MQRVWYETREARIVKEILLACVKVVAVVYLALVMFPNIPLFLDRMSGQGNAPTLYLWQIVFSGCLLVLTLKHWRRYLSLSYFHWVIALALVYFWTLLRLKYFLQDSTEVDISEAIDRIERLMLVPAFIIAIANSSKKTIEKLFFLAIFLVPIPIILGFIFPDLFYSSSANRAAGTFGNANQASEAVLLWFLVVSQRLPRTLIIPVYILVGVAVVLTFSRSGMMAWVLTGACLLYFRQISRLLLILPILAILFYSTLLLNTEKWLSNYIDNDNHVTDLIERIDVFGKLGSGSVEDIDDGSATSREDIARHTLEEIINNPILGYGYDVERNLGLNSHNMPLQLWYTFGLPGLILYIWLAILLFKAGRQSGYGNISPFLVLFLWFSLFDHAHTTENSWLIVYAFLLRRPGKYSWTSKNVPGTGYRNRKKNPNRIRSRTFSGQGASSARLSVRDLVKDLQRKVGSKTQYKKSDRVEGTYKKRRRRKRRRSSIRSSKYNE